MLSPKSLIPAIPLFAISLLSKNQENYYSYSNHYSAGLIVPLIISFHNGLPLAKYYINRIFTVSSISFEYILVAFLVFGHLYFSSSPISRLFWSDKVWSYSWQAYLPTEREKMIKEAISKYIPKNRKIVVVSQNSVNWSELANRRTFLPFPLAVNEPYGVMNYSNRSIAGLLTFIFSGYKDPLILDYKYADFIVLDLKRPYFIVDKGCNWLFGKCTNIDLENKFNLSVSDARNNYRTIYENDGFVILAKRYENK